MKTERKGKSASLFGKLYPGEFSIRGDELIIKLPIKAAEYLELNKGKIFWAPVNGVIQLSSSAEPHVALPALSVDAEQFLAHTEVPNEVHGNVE